MRGQSQQGETLMHMYSGLHNTEANLEANHVPWVSYPLLHYGLSNKGKQCKSL